MKKNHKVVIAVLIFLVGVWLWLFVLGSSRFRAEREHGVRLPPSTFHIQCRGDAWRGFLDRGATTMFEMRKGDLSVFIDRLDVESRRQPVHPKGDPTKDNVWPDDAETWVPGNPEYRGFQRTWNGEATPIEMLSCSSPKGDWLHVELWELPADRLLVVMYTDWN